MLWCVCYFNKIDVTLPRKTVIFCVSIFRMALQKTFGTVTEPSRRVPALTIKVIALKETMEVQHWDFAEEGAQPLSSHKNLVASISDGSSVQKICIV